MPPHNKNQTFSPPFQHRATLLPPSVPNGWPELTEFWPAEGGEFWRAGTVPADQKLGDRNTPARICRNRRLLVRASTGGVAKTPVLTRPDHGWTVLRPGADRARAGSAGGSAEQDKTARDCVDLSPRRRSICARKAHLSLTGGARVMAPIHFFHPPRACRPRPTSPDRIRTSLLPPDRRRCLRARGFAAGGESPSFRHPRPRAEDPFRDLSKSDNVRNVTVWVLGSSPRMTTERFEDDGGKAWACRRSGMMIMTTQKPPLRPRTHPYRFGRSSSATTST